MIYPPSKGYKGAKVQRVERCKGTKGAKVQRVQRYKGYKGAKAQGGKGNNINLFVSFYPKTYSVSKVSMPI